MHTLWLVAFCALYSPLDTAPVIDDIEKEYQWDPYNGTIPTDAVIGGKTSGNISTYVGRVVMPNLVIPTEIRPNEDKVYYIYSGAKVAAKDTIQILRGPHPEQFQWIKANSKNYKFLWTKHIVQAGYHGGEARPFLVGRIVHNNGPLVVGEVLVDDKSIAIYYAADGKEFGATNSEIEILSYNPYIPESADSKKSKEDTKPCEEAKSSSEIKLLESAKTSNDSQIIESIKSFNTTKPSEEKQLSVNEVKSSAETASSNTTKVFEETKISEGETFSNVTNATDELKPVGAAPLFDNDEKDVEDTKRCEETKSGEAKPSEETKPACDTKPKRNKADRTCAEKIFTFYIY